MGKVMADANAPYRNTQAFFQYMPQGNWAILAERVYGYFIGRPLICEVQIAVRISNLKYFRIWHHLLVLNEVWVSECWVPFQELQKTILQTTVTYFDYKHLKDYPASIRAMLGLSIFHYVEGRGLSNPRLSRLLSIVHRWCGFQHLNTFVD